MFTCISFLEELDGGSFAFSKDSSSEQKVDKYSIAFKEDLLLISEDQSVVAFFLGRKGQTRLTFTTQNMSAVISRHVHFSESYIQVVSNQECITW